MNPTVATTRRAGAGAVGRRGALILSQAAMIFSKGAMIFIGRNDFLPAATFS
jgi:hypothetical protein